MERSHKDSCTSMRVWAHRIPNSHLLSIIDLRNLGWAFVCKQGMGEERGGHHKTEWRKVNAAEPENTTLSVQVQVYIDLMVLQ